MAVVLLLVTTAMPVCAQTPTPWPTPIVTGDYVIYQTATYGDGGIILGLLFVGGVMLIMLFERVAERLVDR